MIKQIQAFEKHLITSEKSAATVEKYIRDIKCFVTWMDGRTPDKNIVIEYKQFIAAAYKTTSVNSMLSSLNSFFEFINRGDLKVKSVKMHRCLFAMREKELTRAEYERLLSAAKSRNNIRLYYIMQTICATGIRISELKYITVEAVKRGFAEVDCKGKNRRVMLPKKLCAVLKKYIAKCGIKSGSIFITKSGRAVDRINVWREMKKLCDDTGIDSKKVFPHNLRHLFAVTYYSQQKDVVRLADILGHASINTTRIYTIESGDTHRKQLDMLGLVMGFGQ